MAANTLSFGNLQHIQFKHADEYYKNVKKIIGM